MGTNNSKVLKRSFEEGNYQVSGPPSKPILRHIERLEIDTRAYSSDPRKAKLFKCLSRELDTKNYTESLSNVEDLLKKMKKTSPYISSFLFISQSKSKTDFFHLVFEYGNPGISFQNVLNSFVKICFSMLSALEFLEGIDLFYPVLSLDCLIQIDNSSDSNQFKLINQFCFSDFLDFITDVYLSSQKTPFQIRSILANKKAQNIKEFTQIISKIISYNPNIRDVSHELSNIIFFQKYMEQINPSMTPYPVIKAKFLELFDFNRNMNKQPYNSYSRVRPTNSSVNLRVPKISSIYGDSTPQNKISNYIFCI